MNWYKIVKDNYPKTYSKDDVKVFVVKNKITPEEYEEIVGEPYAA